ncbi:MAG: bifunctional diguanylate cyclase/phosphodiesterase [Nocardioides sp.]|uniref:putative bifunctional diguanylate cyclase/phosphodiesterase n=1 Tax=Nocardioides sp. TaxID=35761 RepID=UPI0039E2BED7
MTGALSRRSLLYVDLLRSWREAPSVGGIRALQATTGGFYLTGGIIALVGALTLMGGHVDRPPIAGLGAFAAMVGIGIIAFGQLMPRWGYHLAVAIGTLLISAIVIFAGGGPASLALATIYSFVLIDSIFLFALREGILQIAFCALACGVSLHTAGNSIGDITVIVSVGLVIGVVVGWLARIANSAEEDALTGLLNRRGFERRLEEELARFHRTGAHLSVVVFDLDDFKGINDAGGHARGDRVLVAGARAWEVAAPDGSALARYGGDEFALLLPGWPLGRAADLADRIRSVAPYGVRVSAGVAAAQPGDSGSVLVSRADVALYGAKTGGRDQTIVHGDPERSASELETAIARGQMALYLQPIVQLSTDEVVGHEALVRWRHPTKGTVSPLDFVPEAERTGAIHSLGRWVLEEAARVTMAAPGPRRSVGVNISVHELRTDDYVDRMAELLARLSMPGDTIVAEVTESVFDDGDPRILANLRGLRELGVIVAVDDFGSGYSSLGRIEQLPIDLIKVDGSLVTSIRDDSYDAPILEAIATMGRSLGVRLLAERVETVHQAAVLRRLGYDLAQGYLFGRPFPS